MLKIRQPNFVSAAGPYSTKIPFQNQAYNENAFNVTVQEGEINWTTVSYLPSPTGYLMNICMNGTFTADSAYTIIINLGSAFYNAYIKNNIGTLLMGSFTTTLSDVAYNSQQYWTAEWLDENRLQLTFTPDDITIYTFIGYEFNIIIK